MKQILSLCLLAALLLGCHEGYVALWTESCQEPAAVYPYPVSSLPPADQQALQEGIPIHSQTELAQRLEDYLS